jgi:hypothetical protein
MLIYSKYISLNARSPDYAVFKRYPFLFLWQLVLEREGCRSPLPQANIAQGQMLCDIIHWIK